MNRSFSTGTLLWIDDDLALDEFDTSGGDLDAWRETFGSADNRVYRLLGMELVTAVSFNDVKSVLSELTGPENGGRFVQAIVDLRIPRDTGGTPEMKYGLAVARLLQKANIPFYFLSSSSDAMLELSQEKFDRIPYYQKKSAPALTMMPDALAHRILADFRNHITWLDISPIISTLSAASRHPLQGGGEEVNYFPFFGSYRDFVERWETRGLAGRQKMYVMRAPDTHSEVFCLQCILLVLSGSSSTIAHRKLTYLDASNKMEFKRLHEMETFRDANQIVVIRVRDATATSTEHLETILRVCRHCTIFVILPIDESADPFLRSLSIHHHAVYDDLPLTRLFDQTAREELIHRSSRFVMQKTRLLLGSSEPEPLHDLYLRHPEILINPIDWTFLMESEDVAFDLSDPTEIMRDMFKTKKEIEKSPLTVLKNLASGNPLEFDELFHVAQDAFKTMDQYHNKWRQQALHEWLSQSWKFPYGITGSVLDSLTKEQEENWEDYCLNTLAKLASKYMEHDILEHELENSSQIINMNSVCKFLEFPAIKDTLAENDKKKDWEGLDSLKWPHLKYPMPAALNRKLNREKRHLFVQTDSLDRATVLSSGQNSLDQLEAKAHRYSLRLSWIKETIPHLPNGWRDSIQLLYSTLIERSLKCDWADPVLRKRLWSAIRAFMQNSAPISYIFYNAWEASRDSVAIDPNVEKTLKTLKGHGMLLSKIRGKRRKLINEAFQIIEPIHSSWLRDFAQAQEGLEFLNSFQNYSPHASSFALLNVEFNALAKKVLNLNSSLENTDTESLFKNIKGELFSLLYDKNTDLHTEKIYQDKFKDELNQNSLLSHGTMRGMPSDILWVGLQTMDKLRNTLHPVMFIDGYHLQSLIGDMRNTRKDSVTEANIETAQQLFEFFVLGFEGICTQLAGCLYASGRADIAERITDSSIKLTSPLAKVDGIDKIFRVRDIDSNNYEIFTQGIPGEKTVSQFTYVDAQDHIHFLNKMGKNNK